MGEAEDAIRNASDQQARRQKEEWRRIAQEVGPQIDGILPKFLDLLRERDYNIKDLGMDQCRFLFRGEYRVGWRVINAYETFDKVYILADGTFVKHELDGRHLTYEQMGPDCLRILETLQDILKRSDPPQQKPRSWRKLFGG